MLPAEPMLLITKSIGMRVEGLKRVAELLDDSHSEPDTVISSSGTTEEI